MIRTTLISALAITAFTMATPSHAQELSQEHIDWCTSTHPSYRAYDNSYLADKSIRKQCSSPYN